MRFFGLSLWGISWREIEIHPWSWVSCLCGFVEAPQNCKYKSASWLHDVTAVHMNVLADLSASVVLAYINLNNIKLEHCKSSPKIGDLWNKIVTNLWLLFLQEIVLATFCVWIFFSPVNVLKSKWHCTVILNILNNYVGKCCWNRIPWRHIPKSFNINYLNGTYFPNEVLIYCIRISANYIC